MQEATHTPGPWKVSDLGIDVYPGHTSIDTVEQKSRPGDRRQWDALAQVVTCVDGKASPEGMANARLIAAAPELLDALEMLEQACSNSLDFADASMQETEDAIFQGNALRKARSVIAKAMGSEAA